MEQTLPDGSDDERPWASECMSLLADMPFPACQDELIATLIRRHAPSRLLQHLADLDRARLYANPQEVVTACGGEHNFRLLAETSGATLHAVRPARGRA